MANFNWTASQEEAIHAAGGDILVSAAAGSGKTAVLVQRVLNKVLDTEKPMEIDSFVIITFTRKAAAQMREKIRKALNAAHKSDPENEHIKRQLLKLHTAKICTIDSLCLDIVRENFHAVDIDPSFRTATKEETDIIKKKVLEEILEGNYASEKRDGSKEAFLDFIESYIGRDDSKIEAIIEQIYSFAGSDAEVYKWMDKSAEVYIHAENLGADMEMPALWIYFKEYILHSLFQLKDTASDGLALSLAENGPVRYAEYFEKYIDTAQRMLKELLNGQVMFSRLKEELEMSVHAKAPAYSAKRMVKENVDPDLQIRAKELLDECRKLVKEDVLGAYFDKSLEEHYKDLASCAGVAKTLISITKEFAHRFEEEKKAAKIADFSDVSHDALKVLIEHDENGKMKRNALGSPVYTKTADHMAKNISEIIVDEYQDTNMLQEYIINALSSERFGRPNVFMVGDMKQSIYRFRFAVPELFMQKYSSYPGTPGKQRVLLQNNFRSRPEILKFANFIFSQIMTPKTGEINYMDGNELVPSPAYEEKPPENTILPEVYIVEGSRPEGRKCEACLVCRRIEKMAGHEEIEDEGQTRKIRYSDIAILTSKNEAPEIEQELETRGIPHIKSSNRGYFDTFEVSLLINLLKVIDNPYQDIPFTAVLRSPLAGFDANDLAILKTCYDKKPFSMYKAALAYINGEIPEGACRLGVEKDMAFFEFMAMISDIRKESLFLSASQLIELLISEFSFYEIFSAMPGGDVRGANIELLSQIALEYEKNADPGLFGFLRYLDSLKKNGYERGQANLNGEGADAVSLMTIHKAKGLEYPVVFLINAGNIYMESEVRDDIILDKDLGLGVDIRDRQTRVKTPTIAKNLIAAKIKQQSRTEQMRVLYVALTRAKERLIVTGTVNNADILKKDAFPDEGHINARDVLGCRSHMALIVRALSNGYKDVCRLEISKASDYIAERLKETVQAGKLKMAIADMAKEGDDQIVEGDLSFTYKYEQAVSMPVKITASSLERTDEAVKGADEKAERNTVTEEGEVEGPPYSKKGVLRGNAYHRFFEILDYGKADEGAAALIKKAIEDGLVNEEEASFLSAKKIDMFLESPLGGRMKNAWIKGCLKREQPYIMGIEKEGGMQLVQGIIDAFFEEDGEYILVDYKTDRGKTKQDFINVYGPQIDAYSEAIEKAIGRPVREKLIYSVELGISIELP